MELLWLHKQMTDRKTSLWFILLIDFVQYFPRTNFVGVAFEDFSALPKICLRRFLSPSGLQIQNRTFKLPAISARLCRRDIAEVSNLFETWCNFSATKIVLSCATIIARIKGRLEKHEFEEFVSVSPNISRQKKLFLFKNKIIHKRQRAVWIWDPHVITFRKFRVKF